MTAQRIMKRIVDNTTPGEKDVYVWDTDLKGFGLKVTPKGRKVYITQYRIGKRTRRVMIGVHGTLTAEEARQKARINLGQVSSGIDPAYERDLSKSGHTVEDLFSLFEDSYLSVRVKPNTTKDYRRVFEHYIFPRFKHVSVRDITKQDMLRLHHDMRLTPIRANHTRAKMSKFFNWCEEHGYRDDYSNPTRHVKKYKENPRHRYLSSEEQKRLGDALNQAETEGVASPYAVDAIRPSLHPKARLQYRTGLNKAITMKGYAMLRELNLNEMEMVSGGMDEVVVTAQRQTRERPEYTDTHDYGGGGAAVSGGFDFGSDGGFHGGLGFYGHVGSSSSAPQQNDIDQPVLDHDDLCSIGAAATVGSVSAAYGTAGGLFGPIGIVVGTIAGAVVGEIAWNMADQEYGCE